MAVLVMYTELFVQMQPVILNSLIKRLNIIRLVLPELEQGKNQINENRKIGRQYAVGIPVMTRYGYRLRRSLADERFNR